MEISNHWSKRHNNVALSSGEAELSGLVKAIAQVLGVKHAAADMGLKLGVKCRGDSSAAQGILMRTGVGKLKRLEVKNLWVQEQIQLGRVSSLKIPRHLNIADLLTHNCNANELAKYLSKFGVIVGG